MNGLCRYRRVPGVLAALLGQVAAWPCLAEGSWNGQVVVTSDYVLRGVSQTDGEPAVQASLAYAARSGLYAGGWVSSLEAADWYYPAGPADAEVDLYAGYRRELAGRWTADLRVTRYLYPGDGGYIDYDYTEVEAAATFRDSLRLSVAWSPDTSLLTLTGISVDRSSLAYELSYRQALLPWLACWAGAGFRDLSGLPGDGYGYWSAGLMGRRGAFSIDFGQYGADDEGREMFGDDLAGTRTVLSVGWTF